MTSTTEEAARRSRMADSLARLRADQRVSGPAPIDVLAVLQRQIDLALSYGNDERAEALQDVRAAIAELIERNREAVRLLESVAPHHPQTAALRAALANVGGAP